MATQQRYPTSDEATTGTWATSPFWSKVDDTSDADFITCSANGRQTFAFAAFAVPTGATGISVAVNFRGRKNGSQAAKLDAALKVGGTYYTTNARNPANGTFTAYTDTWANNPKTAAAWTVDQVNGVDATNPLQAFGMSSGDATPAVDTSSCEIVVTYTAPAITGAATLSATGTVTAAGVRGAQGIAVLAATATITAVGRVVYAAKASLSAVATVAAAGSRTLTGAASVAATVTVTAIGSRFVSGVASLAATATVTAAGTLAAGAIVTGAAILSAGCTLAGAAYSFIMSMHASYYGYTRYKPVNENRDITWSYYPNGNVDEIVVKQIDANDVEMSRVTIKHYQDHRQPTVT